MGPLAKLSKIELDEFVVRETALPWAPDPNES